MRDDFYSTWINCCLLDRSARQVSSSDYVDQFDIYKRLAIRNPLNKSNANSRHWKYESLLRTREYSPHGVRLVWSGIRLIMLISSSYLLFCYDSCEEVDKRHSDKRTQIKNETVTHFLESKEIHRIVQVGGNEAWSEIIHENNRETSMGEQREWSRTRQHSPQPLTHTHTEVVKRLLRWISWALIYVRIVEKFCIFLLGVTKL